jgi:hypothetical protein
MLPHAILGLSPVALATLIGICILGGSAKSTLGIGVPLLAVPLTAPFMDLPAIMAPLTVPIFATNLGQGALAALLLPAWPVPGARPIRAHHRPSADDPRRALLSPGLTAGK